ncbi:MAG TPA: TonB-dependent receptor [Vicinamibacterales bacterium]|nr:TonB-dependent receptor [Vicinamibacterales bacterium]
MLAVRSVIVLSLVVPLGLTTVEARQSPAAAASPQAPPAQGQNPPNPQNPPQPPPTPPELGFKETVVVSASKTEQQLVDAPATMTVIGPRALQVTPAHNYADLLRVVPGLNVTQISARDINITSRGATGSLANSQLAVVDGRSIYQDFYGFTMFDFMPSNLDEIKRIEAIRGPASAVWGANALNGVVNVITKSPRELAGSSITLGVGTFNREVDDDGTGNGSIFYLQGTHAQAVNERWSYKLSAGGYTQDGFARPTGTIPGGSASYPSYANTGTTQPKFDTRVDYDFPDGQRKLQFSGGLAGTDGIMHTGIGPFDIDEGTMLGYWKVNYEKQAFRIQAFMNILNGEATNLVSIDTSGNPVLLDFDTKTFDVELGDTRVVHAKHVLTYGGNLRYNDFDLTIAPGEDSRTEGGAYIQDEFLMHERARIVAGVRVDKFSSIDDPVWSPRVALVLKPRADQSVRVSYNRAFRAPSLVNNNLDITIATPLPLNLFHPAYGNATYLLPTEAVGNPDLTEEHLDTFEVAFTGNIRDRATASIAYYYNDFSNQIFFTQSAAYPVAPPPPGFPSIPGLPGSAGLVWAGAYATGVRFPSEFTYLNLGKVKSQGLELGLNGALTSDVNAFVSYAYQPDPDPDFPGFTEEEALREINIPSHHLFNIGASYVGPRAFGSLSINHASEAFWQDVLDSRFSGITEPYTMVNLTVGMKFQNGRYSAAVKITNLANQEIQQHVFGDIIKRSIVGEFKVNLPR